MKKAIYTCITGDYDNIMNPAYVTPGWDYICFTDNENLTSDFWDVKFIDTKFESTKKARHVKIMSHLYLPDYDITIWIDGNIQPNYNLDEFINIYLDDKSNLGISMHPERDCIYEEIKKCIQLKKDDPVLMRNYGDLLRKLDYPPYNGLVQTGVIIRRNTEDTRDFSKGWWKQVLKYSKRDQLSFNYIMHINPITYNIFSADILKEVFLLYKHLNTRAPSKLKKNYGQNFYYFNTLSYDKIMLVNENVEDSIDYENMSEINKFLYKNGESGFNDFKLKFNNFKTKQL